MNVKRRRNFPECMICHKKPDPLSNRCGRELQLLLTIHICNEDAQMIDWNAVHNLPDEMTLIQFVRMLSGSGIHLEYIIKKVTKAISFKGDTKAIIVKDGRGGEETPETSGFVYVYPPPNRPCLSNYIGRGVIDDEMMGGYRDKRQLVG